VAAARAVPDGPVVRLLDRLLSGDRPGHPVVAVLAVLALVGLALAPFLVPGATALAVAARICIFILLAASYDILLGYTGIVSFAHTMFFGFGAYGAAIALGHQAGWGALLAGAAAGVALAVAVAGLVALLSLRVQAIFFSMVTLAIASFAQLLATQLRGLTGGEDGLTFAAPPGLAPSFRLLATPLLGVRIDGRVLTYYLIFAVTLLLFLAALRVPQLMGATRASIAELLKSLFFIPFAKTNGVTQPLLFIGWSLNYEMFFYLALALGLLMSKRLGIWLGAAIVLLTMLACLPFATHSVVARFYSRDLNLEFLLGIASYYLCRATSDAQARRLRIPALAVCFASAALLIVIQGALPAGQFLSTVSRVLSLGVLAFLLIASASLLSQGGWDTKLASLVLIGDASYILYLIHPYCEYSLDRFFGSRHPWLKSATPTGALIGVALSILFAVLVHLYGERPTVRFLNRHFGGKRKSVEFAPPA